MTLINLMVWAVIISDTSTGPLCMENVMVASFAAFIELIMENITIGAATNLLQRFCQSIIDELAPGAAAQAAKHKLGCRVIQRLIENWMPDQVHNLVEAILSDSCQFVISDTSTRHFCLENFTVVFFAVFLKLIKKNITIDAATNFLQQF